MAKAQKRQKKNDTKESKSLPKYGSKEYWEQRYEKVLPDSEKDPKEVANDEEEPDAFHNWYFTYHDLRPIILPLIMGGKEAAQSLLEDKNDDSARDEKDDDEDPDNSDSPKDDDDGEENEEEGQEDGDDNNKEEAENNDGWEEASDSDDNDETTEESKLETGLAIVGEPISVLEVGCGDAPLVVGLADDLSRVNDDDNQTTLLVHRIVGTDYSSNVISALKRMHQKKRKANGEKTDKQQQRQLAMEFQEADARKLPFPDKSFHLILEKGTMDAMISDPDVGVSNCIQIVSDCARTLAIGGCFFLVSHINAQTEKGEEWLNDVVVTGLRKGGGDDASWSIEVHGNAAPVLDEEKDDNNEDSAGPAVYLIFKSSSTITKDKEKEGSDETPTIPLQFFSY
ncbi:expressed unknown protein [Seminavis robusta]|uniref:Methyltransferase type 11 domain-containing protein n=1 Tax=Seminavis robusta TaxID=568900 RepID=A0A9N8HCW0_9STRA|nr:expressed unknown protein [Seminavis robusta]|eukprot:Sro334_g119870.1 n/a (397) ;mRNA; f:53751-55037